jgi:hypothetical protein
MRLEALRMMRILRPFRPPTDRQHPDRSCSSRVGH